MSSNVLVLGAGELGLAVIHGLSAKRPASTRITVMLRSDDKLSTDPAKVQRGQTIQALGVDVLIGDVAKDSQFTLATHFAPYDLVICCIGFVSASSTQTKITRAVIDAGVARYVPWQFGVDYDIIGRGSAQEVWDEQLDVRDLLRSQESTEWIIVSTGIFTSFLFDPTFGIVDIANGVVHALGSWDTRVTTTTPEDIGFLTAEIVFATNPPARNEVVFIAGDTLTYEQLADVAVKALGTELKKEVWTIEQLKNELQKDPTNGYKKYRVVFAEGSGVSWDKGSTFNHQNGLPVTSVRKWALQNVQQK